MFKAAHGEWGVSRVRGAAQLEQTGIAPCAGAKGGESFLGMVWLVVPGTVGVATGKVHQKSMQLVLG